MATSLQRAHGTETFATQRSDRWWVQPLITFIVLTAFVVYATFRVLEGGAAPGVGGGAPYTADNNVYHYASPFGNPDLTGLVPGFLVGVPVLAWFLASPGGVILPVPAGFRLTCYYYRKAYYRSFAGRPAACSVEATKGRGYRGERGLLIVQNAHRYFLYAALVVLVFNLIDAVRSVITPHGLYFGIGSIIMALNVVFLSGYTLGCHSLRHLVGGKLDCFSCDAASLARYGLWSKLTVLNGRHMVWAWVSLIWVAFTDIYIRYLASTGTTHILGVPA